MLLLLLGVGVAGKAVAHRDAAVPTATPPPILFFLNVKSGTDTLDHTTGLMARVKAARVVGIPVSGKAGEPQQLHIVLQITFRNTGHRTQPADPINFYGLADSGQTYGTDLRVDGVPALRRSTVLPGHVFAGWIAFTVPAAPSRITLLWNDDNRLLPPASLASVSVIRAARK